MSNVLKHEPGRLLDELVSQWLQSHYELVQLPNGLRLLQHELTELTVKSAHIAALPYWMGELQTLGSLSIRGVCCCPNQKMMQLALGQLQCLKSLKLEFLAALETMPDCQAW